MVAYILAVTAYVFLSVAFFEATAFLRRDKPHLDNGYRILGMIWPVSLVILAGMAAIVMTLGICWGVVTLFAKDPA